MERADFGPGESIGENVKDERKWSRRNRCGSLFKNFNGGAPGRKNYLNDD